MDSSWSLVPWGDPAKPTLGQGIQGAAGAPACPQEVGTTFPGQHARGRDPCPLLGKVGLRGSGLGGLSRRWHEGCPVGPGPHRGGRHGPLGPCQPRCRSKALRVRPQRRLSRGSP